MSIQLVLSSHRRRVVSDSEEQHSRVIVLRSQLWENSMIAFKRASFDVSKKIKVVFVGEPSEDEGGPLREFFTLLLQEMIIHSGMFEGEQGHAIPVHNTLALTDGKYFIVGKMIATSLIHGGRAPHCFSRAFSELLVYGQVKSEVDYEEVPDRQVRDKLKKVCEIPCKLEMQLYIHTCYAYNTNAWATMKWSWYYIIHYQLLECTDDQQFQAMVGSSEFDFRFDCGYFKASSHVKLVDRPELVRAIALHYLVLRNHSEIEQIRNGLMETLDFGSVAKVKCCFGNVYVVFKMLC